MQIKVLSTNLAVLTLAVSLLAKGAMLQNCDTLWEVRIPLELKLLFVRLLTQRKMGRPERASDIFGSLGSVSIIFTFSSSGFSAALTEPRTFFLQPCCKNCPVIRTTFQLSH